MTIQFDGETVSLAGGPGSGKEFNRPWVDIDDGPLMDDFEAMFEAGKRLMGEGLAN